MWMKSTYGITEPTVTVRTFIHFSQVKDATDIIFLLHFSLTAKLTKKVNYFANKNVQT